MRLLSSSQHLNTLHHKYNNKRLPSNPLKTRPLCLPLHNISTQNFTPHFAFNDIKRHAKVNYSSSQPICAYASSTSSSCLPHPHFICTLSYPRCALISLTIFCVWSEQQCEHNRTGELDSFTATCQSVGRQKNTNNPKCNLASLIEHCILWCGDHLKIIKVIKSITLLSSLDDSPWP